jgi:hypothetical protein
VPHDCRTGFRSPALLTTSPVRSVALQFKELPLEPLGAKLSTLRRPNLFYFDSVLVACFIGYSLVVIVAVLCYFHFDLSSAMKWLNISKEER